MINTLQGVMDGKCFLFKKPAAGAARIWILYRSPPLENAKKNRKGGGSVRNYCDGLSRVKCFLQKLLLRVLRRPKCFSGVDIMRKLLKTSRKYSEKILSNLKFGRFGNLRAQNPLILISQALKANLPSGSFFLTGPIWGSTVLCIYIRNMVHIDSAKLHLPHMYMFF